MVRRRIVFTGQTPHGKARKVRLVRPMRGMKRESMAKKRPYVNILIEWPSIYERAAKIRTRGHDRREGWALEGYTASDGC